MLLENLVHLLQNKIRRKIKKALHRLGSADIVPITFNITHAVGHVLRWAVISIVF